MKKIFYLIILLQLSTICISQKEILSIGPEFAFPKTFGLKRNAGTGIGGSLRFESSWGKHITGMLTAGYLVFAEKELDYSGTPPTVTKVTAIPILAGIKYYIKEIKEKFTGFFVSAEVGFMQTNTHFDYAVVEDRNFRESGFTYAPGIGYQLENIELGFRLQYHLAASGYNKIYYYNVRIAYAILRKKGKNKSL